MNKPEKPLTSQSYIRELLARYGLAAQKSKGQNFLTNPSVCPKMAVAAVGSEITGILEIGPGLGVLTRELAAAGSVAKGLAPMGLPVVAVEIDRGLEPVLLETVGSMYTQNGGNLEVIFDDVLELDLNEIIESRFGGGPIAVCANLPYYITTPIIMKLLETGLNIESITVMVQHEVARRVCAPPGTRLCGAVTAAVHYYAEPKLLFPVSAGSFYPAPKVDSAVLRLDIRRTPAVEVENPDAFLRMMRSAFSARRKTLINSLQNAGYNKEAVQAAFAACGLDTRLRAEQMTLEMFAGLYGAMTE